MTEQDRALCLASIRQHEGFSPKPVADTGGSWVVGFGWNPYRLPMTEGQAAFILDQQVDTKLNELTRAWAPFATCDGPRQQCLLEISYQIGVEGLMLFREMLHAIAIKDYETAADEVLNSTLARQTPRRAADYAALLRETV